jgi:hypothetical protein
MHEPRLQTTANIEETFADPLGAPGVHHCLRDYLEKARLQSQQ